MEEGHTQEAVESPHSRRRLGWRLNFQDRIKGSRQQKSSNVGSDMEQAALPDHEKQKEGTWNMGMLNDLGTEEVPGTILLLSKVSQFNEPLGLRNAPHRTSTSSFPQFTRTHSQSSVRNIAGRRPASPVVPRKKTTQDGTIVLEPQPDDSANDPLNWSTWRRDAALLSLGFYCMLGGGMTPILAAGFDVVADEFHVSVPRVALTTGLYMMGLGLGSVVLSPTAILFGKRPVYLVAAVCFVLSGIWCASSHSFASLICARIFQGFAVSSVECLPSATVAEIYFLHEKAYRLGIYTLLLLGGKNLVPLVSASIIQSLGWRWVFWMVSIIVGFGLVLLFFFVPETFWDRSPSPRRPRRRRSSNVSLANIFRTASFPSASNHEQRLQRQPTPPPIVPTESLHDVRPARRAHFDVVNTDTEKQTPIETPLSDHEHPASEKMEASSDSSSILELGLEQKQSRVDGGEGHSDNSAVNNSRLEDSQTPSLHSVPSHLGPDHDPRNEYTKHFASQPKKTYVQSLRPWSGRMSGDKWLKAAARPFILYAYPAILWSSLVYALSIGWLIVLSESVSVIYISRSSYGFTSLQAGLVYISPFVGGILGTAVAGKVSDVIVRYMARRNGGIYEPEFRLVMGIPIAIFTTIGLMGYGWSAHEHDFWFIPTLFFGFISFGCSLGSTTSITFAVDSYRQYAGEALVTLNFSKNILHGLVWSLFFNRWLEAQGSRTVFVAIGGIQFGCLLSTIPMYIYGKRARMWTVRRNLMEKL